jgi:hypothetical protein
VFYQGPTNTFSLRSFACSRGNLEASVWWIPERGKQGSKTRFSIFSYFTKAKPEYRHGRDNATMQYYLVFLS